MSHAARLHARRRHSSAKLIALACSALALGQVAQADEDALAEVVAIKRADPLDLSLFLNNTLNRTPRLYTTHQVFNDPNGGLDSSLLYTSFTERPRTGGLTAVYRVLMNGGMVNNPRLKSRTLW